MSAIQRTPFGQTADGRPVEKFTLTNRNGCRAGLITYGATLTELHVKDRAGALADVALGFETLRQYETQSPYFGCTTGRFANRIAHGRFTLDGRDYTLACNDGANHLHGGVLGLDKRVWNAEAATLADGPAVRFSYLSPDNEEGYPGALNLEVTYVLTDSDELRIEYKAVTDRPTPVNLTNHTYFNLTGGRSGGVLDHVLTLHAHAYTEVDDTLTPTGRILPVAGTALDFTRPHPVGERIAQLPAGYDHNFVLTGGKTEKPKPAAELFDPASGRRMLILTTEPGIQLYTGNFLDGTLAGKYGLVYRKHHALCLETQHYPDSVHHPHFPPVILRPGETYRQITCHRFSA